MTIAAVVLAAGRSSRMGAPKALLDFRGEPFVVRILEALTALDLKPRVVVVGPDGARVREALVEQSCLVVENPDVESGPIGSLRVALAALRTPAPAALLVWPVDYPHVRVDTVEKLVEAHRRTGAAVVLPVFGERRGHPVIWGATLFDELATSPAAAREGARAVLHAHAAEVLAVPVDDPAVIDGLNTPADYERLVRDVNRDLY